MSDVLSNVSDALCLIIVPSLSGIATIAPDKGNLKVLSSTSDLTDRTFCFSRAQISNAN